MQRLNTTIQGEKDMMISTGEEFTKEIKKDSIEEDE